MHAYINPQQWLIHMMLKIRNLYLLILADHCYDEDSGEADGYEKAEKHHQAAE